MSAPESDIREALAAYMTDAAETEKAGVATERRFRMLRGINRSRRLDIMGSDLYYLEVLPTDGTLTDQAPSRVYRDRAYTYNVALHHRYEDADTYAGASQSTWDPIAEAAIDAVAQGSFLPTAGGFTDRIEVELQDSFQLDIQPLDQAYQDVVHTLTMTLTCTT